MKTSTNLRFQCFVRLACVRHAASVHPEPGSNSQIKWCPIQVRTTGSFPVLLFVLVELFVRSMDLMSWHHSASDPNEISEITLCWIERSRLFCYSVIKFLCCFRFFLRKLLYSIIFEAVCQELLYFILNSLIKLFIYRFEQLWNNTTHSSLCQYLFHFIFIS